MTQSKYSGYQIRQVYSLAQKGISDGEISKKLKISLSVVQAMTTKYWERKMKKAYED